MAIDGARAADFLKDYVIPEYILVPGSDITEVTYVPSCPVMVFINSRSGGQLGAELLVTYRSLLNQNQVSPVVILFDIIIRKYFTFDYRCCYAYVF